MKKIDFSIKIKQKSYKVKIKRVPDVEVPPVIPGEARTGEYLTGQVNGYKASDIEERYARGLSKLPYLKGLMFRYVFFGPRNSSGSVEVDYVVSTASGRAYVVLIDGEYAHKSAAQIERDRLNDQKLWNSLKNQISAPPIRIPYDKLATQEMADATARETII